MAAHKTVHGAAQPDATRERSAAATALFRRARRTTHRHFVGAVLRESGLARSRIGDVPMVLADARVHDTIAVRRVPKLRVCDVSRTKRGRFRVSMQRLL